MAEFQRQIKRHLSWKSRDGDAKMSYASQIAVRELWNRVLKAVSVEASVSACRASYWSEWQVVTPSINRAVVPYRSRTDRFNKSL